MSEPKPMPTYWALAEEVTHLHGRLDQLEAENAKLREDLEFERSENGWVREFLNRMGQKCGTRDCPSLVAHVTKLEAENAKLRELVRDMYYCCSSNDRCHPCPYFSADMECPEPHFSDRMAQLGVEVDG